MLKAWITDEAADVATVVATLAEHIGELQLITRSNPELLRWKTAGETARGQKS